MPNLSRRNCGSANAKGKEVVSIEPAIAAAGVEPGASWLEVEISI